MDPKIGALTIERFRALRQLKIDGLGRVNLITGRNNTGKSSVLELALSVVRPTGRLVVLGYAADGMKLNAGRVQYRELTIIGTLGCRSVDFPVVLDLVRAGRLDVRPLVTHRHSLEDVNAGYDLLRRGEGVRHIVVFDRHAR